MAQKKAYIKLLDGMTFSGITDSGSWVMMDAAPESGGRGGATKPKELLLLGLGGCTAMDVVSILKKKRVDLKNFEVNIQTEMTEEHPQVFTKFNIEYVFYGNNIKPQDVERAIELSQTKYCGVSAMYKSFAEITHTYRIVE